MCTILVDVFRSKVLEIDSLANPSGEPPFHYD